MQTSDQRGQSFSGFVRSRRPRGARWEACCTGILVLVLLLSTAALAAVKEPPAAQEPSERNWPVLSGSFLTFFLWENDRDFDRTEPVFNEYGQSAGYVDVTIFPRLYWELSPNVSFGYYAEIGDAFWSRNTTDPRSQIISQKPVYLQKNLWAQILLPWHGYGVRAGIMYAHDPTFLFLEKDVGALHAFYQQTDMEIRFTALQVPDTTFEGFDFNENNFENDVFVFALDGTLATAERIFIRPGLWFKYDREDVNRPKYLFNPCLNLSHNFGRFGKWMLDLVLQAGTWESHSINNRDQTLLAGAVQVHGSFSIGKAMFEANAFTFTADDSDPYNGIDTSFDYSGLSRSRTLVLTQNWLFDQYDNLDEVAAASKAGYFLIDLFTNYPLGKGVQIFNVIGYAMVLEEKYANGGRTVGTEIDAGLFWFPYPKVRLTALGGVVLPGQAGAAFQNMINLTATDPLYYFQGAFEVYF